MFLNTKIIKKISKNPYPSAVSEGAGINFYNTYSIELDSEFIINAGVGEIVLFRSDEMSITFFTQKEVDDHPYQNVEYEYEETYIRRYKGDLNYFNLIDYKEWDGDETLSISINTSMALCKFLDKYCLGWELLK